MANNVLSNLSELTVGDLCAYGLCSDLIEVNETHRSAI